MPGINFIRLIQTIALSNVTQGTLNITQKLEARNLQTQLDNLKDTNSKIKDNLFECLDDDFLNRNTQFKEEIKELFDWSEQIVNNWDAVQEYFKALRNANQISGDTPIFNINEEYLNEIANQLSIVRDHNLALDEYRFRIRYAFDTEHLTKFVDKNQISEYLQYVQNLNFEHTIYLVHLSASIVILVSLISIIFTFYSNFIIDYFKLENKYPKLAKYLQLKKKFQHFFLFIDLSIITIVCFLVSYLNLLLLGAIT